jgi:hypothetical protein
VVVGSGLRGGALFVQNSEMKRIFRKGVGSLVVGGLLGIFGVNFA